MFDLKIGFECNNNCIHCVVADKRPAGHLDIPHLRQYIKKASLQATVDDNYIQITGGEPTIVSYLPEILQYCKEVGLKTVLQTNGTGFSDLSFLDKCLPYLDHVHIAIHSSNPEIHNQIVCDKKNIMWDKTIQGFKNLLLRNKCEITTQTVLSNLNMPTLFSTFSFIQNLAPGIVMSMTYPHLMGNAWSNRDEVVFKYSSFKNEIQKVLEAFAPLIFVESIPPCYLYPYQDKLNGSIENDLLEGARRVGVDFSGGFDNFNNYLINDLRDRRKAPLCKECVFNSKCVGVWKEYIQLFKSNLDLYPIKDLK